MRVTIKIAVFKHPNTTMRHLYYAYCPAFNMIGAGETVDYAVKEIERRLILLLEHRGKYPSYFKGFGWEITKDSIKVPTFTDEYAIKETKRIYEVENIEPQIIETNVELPPIRERF